MVRVVLNENGLTLVEVLVSLFLLSILLLGFDAMQVVALQKTKSAYYFSVATQQLNSMLERLKLIDENALETFTQEWNKQNKIVLPEGRGVINQLGNDNVELLIFWGGDSMQTCAQNVVGQEGCLRIVA